MDSSEIKNVFKEALDEWERDRRAAELRGAIRWRIVHAVFIITVACILFVALATYGGVEIDGERYDILTAADKLGVLLPYASQDQSVSHGVSLSEFYSYAAGYISIAILIAIWAYSSIAAARTQNAKEIKSNLALYAGFIGIALTLVQISGLFSMS